MDVIYKLPKENGGASAEGCVRYDQEQTLTDEQQQQVRENIGALAEVKTINITGLSDCKYVEFSREDLEGMGVTSELLADALDGKVLIQATCDNPGVPNETFCMNVLHFSEDHYSVLKGTGNCYNQERGDFSLKAVLVIYIDDESQEEEESVAGAAELSFFTDNEQVQSDWNVTDPYNPAFIKNKPTIPEYPAMMTSITWENLKALRDGGGLTPGAWYRITDYQCTTKTTNTQSADKQFDIIVQATSTNTIGEEARAAKHEGGTNFEKTEAWKVWYCLDNDTTRFNWASSSGKGVIYRLIDHNGNDCPYDFKNIMFKVGMNNTAGTLANVFYYTFSRKSGNTILDSSNGYNCRNNKIGVDYDRDSGSFVYRKLPITVFLCKTSDDCCIYNRIGINCSNNLFGANCKKNIIGNGCANNSFGECVTILLGEDCSGNNISGSYNSFGFGCKNNTLTTSSSNTFDSECTGNTLTNSSYNSFGVHCNNNTLGSGCSNNNFQSNNYGINLGNYCSFNSFRNRASNITFGPQHSAAVVENNVSYFSHTATGTYNNFIILAGVEGTSSAPVTADLVANASYTQCVGRTTDGDIRVWNLSDDAGGGEAVQSDWNETDSTDPAFIKNKPTIPQPENHQLLRNALSEPLGCQANTWHTLCEVTVPEDGAYQVSASVRAQPSTESTYSAVSACIEIYEESGEPTEYQEIQLPRSGEYGTMAVPVEALRGQKIRLRAYSSSNFYAQAAPSAGKASATFIAAVRVGAIYSE